MSQLSPTTVCTTSVGTGSNFSVTMALLCPESSDWYPVDEALSNTETGLYAGPEGVETAEKVEEVVERLEGLEGVEGVE